MEKERENDLIDASNLLLRYNLWRRGYIHDQLEDTPQEIGVAIEVACGAIYNLISSAQYEEMWSKMASRLASERNEAKEEVIRLRAILAAHHIKYKKGK